MMLLMSLVNVGNSESDVCDGNRSRSTLPSAENWQRKSGLSFSLTRSWFSHFQKMLVFDLKEQTSKCY